MALPPDRIEKRLLILWFALACVVWNGVYDMRMHDTVRGYLVQTVLQGSPGGGVDMRAYLHRGLVDAIAFSTAWSLGVFLAGLVTMRVYQKHPAPSTEH
jgi:hypothetical protein